MGGLISSIFGGGGPSREMKAAASQEQTLANLLMSNYQGLYGEQQDLFGKLKAAYSPIVAAGPDQQGFSSPVLASLNTQILNSGSAANRAARQASANFAAGQGGGGTSGLQSGIQKQIQASIASNSANQVANAQTNLSLKNFELGRDNFFRSAGGLDALAGLESPTATGGMAGSELSSVFHDESKINDEVNAQRAALAGGIASLAVDAATFGAGGIANMSADSSGLENAGNFFAGGFKSLGNG